MRSLTIIHVYLTINNSIYSFKKEPVAYFVYGMEAEPLHPLEHGESQTDRGDGAMRLKGRVNQIFIFPLRPYEGSEVPSYLEPSFGQSHTYITR